MAVTRGKTPQVGSDQPGQSPSALVTTTGSDLSRDMPCGVITT